MSSNALTCPIVSDHDTSYIIADAPERSVELK